MSVATQTCSSSSVLKMCGKIKREQSWFNQLSTINSAKNNRIKFSRHLLNYIYDTVEQLSINNFFSNIRQLSISILMFISQHKKLAHDCPKLIYEKHNHYEEFEITYYPNVSD